MAYAPLASHTLIITKNLQAQWCVGTRPSVAGTLSLKQCSRVHQKHANFIQKIEKKSLQPRTPLQARGRDPFLHPLSLSTYCGSPRAEGLPHSTVAPLPKSKICHCFSLIVLTADWITFTSYVTVLHFSYISLFVGSFPLVFSLCSRASWVIVRYEFVCHIHCVRIKVDPP